MKAINRSTAKRDTTYFEAILRDLNSPNRAFSPSDSHLALESDLRKKYQKVVKDLVDLLISIADLVHQIRLLAQNYRDYEDEKLNMV